MGNGGGCEKILKNRKIEIRVKKKQRKKKRVQEKEGSFFKRGGRRKENINKKTN
jgi:hypothetical protein